MGSQEVTSWKTSDNRRTKAGCKMVRKWASSTRLQWAFVGVSTTSWDPTGAGISANPGWDCTINFPLGSGWTTVTLSDGETRTISSPNFPGWNSKTTEKKYLIKSQDDSGFVRMVFDDLDLPPGSTLKVFCKSGFKGKYTGESEAKIKHTFFQLLASCCFYTL